MNSRFNTSFSLYTRLNFFILAILFILCQTGCKKLVEVDGPKTSINGANVYTSDATASAVLTGIYIKMSTSDLRNGGVTSMSLLPGLSADELTLYSAVNSETYNGYYRNALTNSNIGYPDFWVNNFRIIFVTNSAIEGLANSTSLTLAVKEQLLGEAKFMRAFCYFYLVNLYGDIPLITTTDYKVNAILPRTTQVDVWKQIIDDLKDAQNLLSSDYMDANLTSITTERVRPNKWAATALLARVYLYIGKYEDAEEQSTQVINNSSLYNLSELKDVFLKNSTEAIWQLQPVNSGWNTEDARLFIIPDTGPSAEWPVYLSNTLLNSFEVNDQRKNKWIGKYTDTIPNPHVDYYYSFKYKIATRLEPVTEYHMVLRLGEQYLIRAEARAKLGNISGATLDLNRIRTRADLANTTADTQSNLLSAIIHERQVELFIEWGHRWLDLKRTKSVDDVMTVVTPQKGGTWNTNWQWYPIPVGELQKGINLVQNIGY